jgi:glycosyltransferase involved in cell wall biosynthesis
MNVLIVIPYEGYFSRFSSHLEGYLGAEDIQRATVTTVMPPYYSYYSKTRKILNKRQVVIVMLFNFFYFVYDFAIRKRRKYDVILLAGHVVAIPYLFLVRIFPFINARKNIIVMSFFLHGIGRKKFVRKILRFVLRDKRVFLIVQSDYEVEYYSQLMDKAKVIHFPFCQHEVPVSEDCGKGEEYIFAGGYTNRDYECLFEAARKVSHKFIVICSRLNQMDGVSQKPGNIKLLREVGPADFNGYLNNSKIVIIPLKEKTGSSGQMVALAAMFFKKPIIYTNIDSVSQYFEDGVSGIGYEINNAEDLADKICHLLSEPQLREKLGANAYKTYCEKYHISNYCKFLADLIRFSNTTHPAFSRKDG